MIKILASCLCLFISSTTSLFAVERVYYVAADEVIWDYAPVHKNVMMGGALSEGQELFVKQTANTIGSKYKKALYREYTDASFSQLKVRNKSEVHLGMLGPIFRAEVGDTIKVVFKNNASRPYSIHPHGVFYTKGNEGAPTNDGTSGKLKRDDKVMPGTVFTYKWGVPETAGPGSADGSSIVWLYHSHVMGIKDSNSGLVGALVITAKGMATVDGRPNDIDREFISFYSVMNENQSWYLESNIESQIGQSVDVDDEDFVEGNLMHAINGYVFGNQPGLNMKVGENVRWHLVALGTEVDLHTPHWHGNTGLLNGRRTDTVDLLPASMRSLDMHIGNAGTWMYHCHVNDHISAGMTALYHVTQ